MRRCLSGCTATVMLLTMAHAAADPAVRVHLSSNERGAELQRYRSTATVDVARPTPYGFAYGTADVDVYEPVCTAPCDITIDPRGTFRVGGPALHPSAPFQLVPSGDNEIDATLATRSKRSTGKALLYVGIPLTAVGAMFFTIGALSEDKVNCAGCVNYHRTGMLWGGILGGVGVGLLTTGIVVLVGAQSSVSINGNSVARVGPGLYVSAQGLHF